MSEVGCWDGCLLMVVLFAVGCCFWMLDADCWLLVVGCWLLCVGCWVLLVVGCWMLVHCWLLAMVVCCWLLVVCCWVVCWLLVAGCCLLGVWRCLLVACHPARASVLLKNPNPCILLSEKLDHHMGVRKHIAVRLFDLPINAVSGAFIFLCVQA